MNTFRNTMTFKFTKTIALSALLSGLLLPAACSSDLNLTVAKTEALLALGNFHTCILTDNEGVDCWGKGDVQTVVPEDTTFAATLAAGAQHTCAAGSDGLKCWGYGSVTDPADDGQHHGQSSPPVIDGQVNQLAAGYYHSCALDSTGSVTCWGAGDSGDADDGGLYHFGQSDVPALGTISAIAAGAFHTCALAESGSVTCWGAGETNTNNNSNYGQSIVPADLGKATAISAGLSHTCAIVSGNVRCWGSDSNDQSTPPAGLGKVDSLACGDNHCCAVKVDDGSAACWGAGIVDLATVPHYGQANPPVLKDITSMAAGQYHTCAYADESVTCWGAGSTAVESHPNFAQSLVPTKYRAED